MNGPMSPSLVETMGTPGIPVSTAPSCTPDGHPGAVAHAGPEGLHRHSRCYWPLEGDCAPDSGAGADYVLRVRANHKGLHARLEDTFALERAGNFAGYVHDDADTVGKGHGRIEIRRCWTTGDPDREWRDLASLVRVESERRCSDRVSTEVRYFIPACPPEPSRNRGGAQALDHRERPPLGPGRGLRRGGQPHPHRPCRPQHGHPWRIANKRLAAAWNKDYLCRLIGLQPKPVWMQSPCVAAGRAESGRRE